MELQLVEQVEEETALQEQEIMDLTLKVAEAQEGDQDNNQVEMVEMVS